MKLPINVGPDPFGRIHSVLIRVLAKKLLKFVLKKLLLHYSSG
jgi:hypothetical protein